MATNDLSHYSVYRTVIEQVMRGTESLPSLPSITIKVRQELSSPNTTNRRLAEIIEKDPALCALIVKNASNPYFNTAAKPKDLEGILRILGMTKINEIVMLHSVKSLYTMRNPEIKSLYHLTWERLITKAIMSSVLANLLRFPGSDQIMVTSLLTEVGTLAVLSALNQVDNIPEPETYIRLCREYSMSLGVIILNKWGMNSTYVDALKKLGKWDLSQDDTIVLTDVLNLGLYQSILWQNSQHDLPPIHEIAAYNKLPTIFKDLQKSNILTVLENKRDEINEMLSILM